jgi:hypothetical protein
MSGQFPFRPEIGHNGTMRRSFAGLFFAAAFLCGCLATSGFLLQRTLFAPSTTSESAAVVLGDPTLNRQLVEVIATAAAPVLGEPEASVNATVSLVLGTRAGAELLAGALADAHAHLIGDSEAPVVITPRQLVDVVRDERAAAVAPVVLPVPRITALAVTKDIVGWLVPLAAIGIVVFLVLCFLAHPDRAALVRTLGLGLIVLAALVGLFGYVIPKFVPTVLSDSVYARIPPRLADDHATLTVFSCLMLAAAGLALFAASARMGRSRRWSTPISSYRYREERRWS